MMQDISFTLKLLLQPNLKDNKIRLDFENENILLENNNKKEIVFNLTFNKETKNIPLITFSQFKADPLPSIKIKKLFINGYEVRELYKFFSFDMKDNLYVENKNILETELIDFNGVLNLEIQKNIDQFLWFPYTFSTERNSMVLRNSILGCQSEYGCFGPELGCVHKDPWQRFNFDKYVDKDYYDYIALGCSVTAGSGILKKLSWPSLLEDGGEKNVLNLGVPGGGCDAVLLNVKEIIKKKVNFKKIVILLPGKGRQVFNIRKNGYFFNLILGHSSPVEIIPEGKFNIYFDKEELEEIVRINKRKLVLNSYKRDDKIIKRLIRYLNENNIDFYISSYKVNSYRTLESCVEGKNLLPMFNKEDNQSKGKDGVHPSEKIHEKWVNSIKKQIGYGE
jgi:hypothetical protein